MMILVSMVVILSSLGCLIVVGLVILQCMKSLPNLCVTISRKRNSMSLPPSVMEVKNSPLVGIYGKSYECSVD